MFPRLSQITRHLSAAAPIRTPKRPALNQINSVTRSIMATADERNSRTVHTAACLVIGDEVLGGKTVDTNSAYMAKWCFALGINLKRVEVIEDDESEIIEAVRRLSDRYDFIVTSGGIGPTHDDITYESIAKAFDLPLILNQKTFERMKRLSKRRPSEPPFDWDSDSPALRARLRMAIFPTDETRELDKQFIFPHDDLWVPVVVVNDNVHILPGVPRLFEKLLDGLKPVILPRLTDPDGKGLTRALVSTPLPESAVAEFLGQLAAKVEPHGVKVGSYPRWEKNGIVTLVGRNREYIESIVPELVKGVKGRRVTFEGEDDLPPEERAKPNSD